MSADFSASIVEHLKLLESEREIWRKDRVADADYKKALGLVGSGSRDLRDGYQLTGGYLSLKGCNYVFGLYTHKTGLVHHWCGYFFSLEGHELLSSALIFNKNDIARVIDRLCGSLLAGMPHFPSPLENGYPLPERFPCVMSMAYPRVPLPSAGMHQTKLYEFLPSFTFAVIDFFHERGSRS